MKETNLRNIMPAKEYEEYTATFLKPWDDMLIKRCELLNPLPMGRGRLLDVGTGTGVLLEKLMESTGFANYKLEGIDYYEDNVVEATTKFKNNNMSGKISVTVGDAHLLAFEDNAFDFVISRATLHHLVDPVKALKEKYRVLNKEGICLIHDMKKDVSPEVLNEFNALRKQIGYPPTVVEEKYTVKDIERFIALAGLSDCASVKTSDSGLASLGYELLIWKRERKQKLPGAEKKKGN